MGLGDSKVVIVECLARIFAQIPMPVGLSLRLQRLLEANHRWRDPIANPLNCSPHLAELQRWQAGRLRRSFRDLLAQPDTRLAAEFFLHDLYGDHDVSARDQGIARVMPLMQRLLPEAFLQTAADGIELAVLSHAMDLRVARECLSQSLGTLDAQHYAHAYRRAGHPRLRRQQIDLVVRIGLALGDAVRKPALGRLLRASRLPARMSGLGELQQFLERGFSAFAKIDDVTFFLRRIEVQEREVSRRLFAGLSNPFTDT